jgi:UDP-glucose 4-epimerase
VVDLADGHIKALKKLEQKPGLKVYNLGTGRGTSVLEMVSAFHEATGIPIPYAIAPRRPGDIAMCYADPSKAAEELGWKAGKTVRDMCEDTWRWQSANPTGYPD